MVSVALVAMLATIGSQARAAGSRQVFSGVLGDSPAYRDIHLKAGDALKLWATPNGSQPTDNVGFGIAMTASQFARIKPYYDQASKEFLGATCSGQPGYTSAGAGFYQAYSNTHRFRALGQILFFQQGKGWEATQCGFAVNDYPTFWQFDFCHGCGTTYQSHTWAAFVAPTTATYRILFGGEPGGYKLGLATETLRPHVVPVAPPTFDQSNAAHDKVFPYSGRNRWIAVVKSHRAFFLAPGFFPKLPSRDDNPLARLRSVLR
jgi:hypothetical protein